MKKNIKTMITITAIIVAAIFIFLLLKDLIPLLKQVVSNTNDESQMIQYIKAYGIKGIPLLVGLQFLQVMIPFFPSSPIQVLGGLCYGVLLGSLLCIIGFVLGHSLLFAAMRKLGNTLTPLLSKKTEGKHSKALNQLLEKNTFKTQQLVFLLYLIPFFPNGLLPFLFARTKISYKKYIVYMSAAAVPSTVLCAAAGDRLAAGDLRSAIIIAVIFLLIAVTGYFLKDKLLTFIGKK